MRIERDRADHSDVLAERRNGGGSASSGIDAEQPLGTAGIELDTIEDAIATKVCPATSRYLIPENR